MLNDKILSEFREAYKDITSDKSWVKTLLLCEFGGYLGLHRFYTRRNKTAIIQLVLSLSVIGLPIAAIWAIYDFFQILYNDFTDSDNKILDRNITRKSVALTTFFLGHIGISDFYIKDYKKGLIKLLLFISGIGSLISIIWNLIDLHLICFSKIKFNKYSGLKNDFDTKICILLLLVAYLSLVMIFCYLSFSSANSFHFNTSSISTGINNIWIGFVTLVKNIIKWIMNLIFYSLCGILAIAAIIGSIGSGSKPNNKSSKSKSNNKHRYAIISYQYEGQIFSFKVNDIYESNIDKTIWVTDEKGFNTTAKFLSINEISFSDYSHSNLPDYRFKKDFYRKH